MNWEDEICEISKLKRYSCAHCQPEKVTEGTRDPGRGDHWRRSFMGKREIQAPGRKESRSGCPAEGEKKRRKKDTR